MIELMLEAERAMGIGLFDKAERLYRQVVDADPKNSIAVTGLARVALERGDQREAYVLARKALSIDPENPVAAHLAHRMGEQLQIRGEALPDEGDAGPTGPAAPAHEAVSPAASPTEPASSSLVGRLLRRRR